MDTSAPPAYTRKDATFAQIAGGIAESGPEFSDPLLAFKEFLASQENVTLNKDQLGILKSQGIYVLQTCAKHHKETGEDLSNVLPTITQIFSGVSKQLDQKSQWDNVIQNPTEANELESAIGDASDGLADQLRKIVKGEDAESTMYKDELGKAREKDRRKIKELESEIRRLEGSNQSLQEIIDESMTQNLKIIGDRGAEQPRVDAKRSLAIIAELTGKSLPPSTILDKEFVAIGPFAISQGQNYDVYLGEYFTGEKIAIKLLRHRIDQDTARKTQERFARQAENWSKLRHDCILPLYGIGVRHSPVSDTEFELYLVSPYLQNQDVRRYLKNYNPPPKSRLQMILDIARGLKYMHTGSDSSGQGLVHSALNIFNVLVKDSGRAVISGFGHAKVIEPAAPPQAFTGDNPEYRYLGPEILDDQPLTFGCDIWPWAMTSLEILTDEPPFGVKTRGHKVIQLISAGTRPERKDHPKIEEYDCCDELWQLLEECWQRQPEDRPSANVVAQRVKKMLRELGKRTDPAAQGYPPPGPTPHDLGRKDPSVHQPPPLPDTQFGRAEPPVVGPTSQDWGRRNSPVHQPPPLPDQFGKAQPPVVGGAPIPGGWPAGGDQDGKAAQPVVGPPGDS